MSGQKKNSKNKKWYQKAWDGIKKVAIITYKALTSNIVSISLAAGTIALGVATGGIVPIAIASVVLTVKLVRVGIDAAKAVKIRNLDIENKGWIKLANAT
jgi:spermidine/putrescine-binding protein